jgi:hypothetical protein
MARGKSSTSTHGSWTLDTVRSGAALDGSSCRWNAIVLEAGVVAPSLRPLQADPQHSADRFRPGPPGRPTPCSKCKRTESLQKIALAPPDRESLRRARVDRNELLNAFGGRLGTMTIRVAPVRMR